MKYTFTILIDGNYYDEDEEFEKDIELSDDEIAAIKKLVDDYESDLSCGLIPILEAGSEELYHKFYDAIFPHVFFVLFQRDPCFEPEPGDEDKIWDEDEDIEYLMETYGDGYDFDDAFVVYIPDEMMPQKPTLTKSMTNEDLQEYINKWYHNIQESIFNIIRWGDHAFSNELDDDLMIIINDKLLSYLNQTIKDNNDEVIAKTDFEPFTDDIQKKIANEAFDELKEKNDPQNKKHHIMKFDKQELEKKIRDAKDLSNEDKSNLLQLLKEKKTYGLVWEDSTEDAWEMMKDNIPVLKEDETKQILHGSDNPNHILIEGDNLNALTALSYTHEGKIDVIYIDPPYNTGATTWKYNNDYVDKDDVFRHSKWLSMMHHRLVIAKRLLNSENSALIVTIDEVESANLSCMLQELFPYAKIQMVTSVICPGGRGKKAGEDLSNTEEFIFFVRIGGCTVLPEIKDETSTPLGWRSLIRGTLANGRGKHGIGSCGPNQFYPIYVDNSTKKIVKIGTPLPENVSRYTAPELEGCTAVFPIRPDGTEMNWGCVPEEAVYRLENGYLRVGSYTPSKPQPYVIQYLTKGVIRDIQEGKAIITGRNKEGYVEGFYPEGKPTMPTTVWNRPTHNATQYGTNLLTSILGSQMFDYPKSLYAVMDCVRFISGRNKNAKILDFFAGSGTTLHATMQLNAEDGGHRQCILVTNNENKICEEVTYERNKRVIEGYTTPKGEFVEGLTKNNFRYYKVDFKERKQSHQSNRELLHEMKDLLCIKEDIYQEQQQFGSLPLKGKERMIRYFSENGREMLMVYDTRVIPFIVKEIEKMSEKEQPLKIYIFADGAYPYTDDFATVIDKVSLVPMPYAYYRGIKDSLPDVEPKKEDSTELTDEEQKQMMAEAIEAENNEKKED